MLVFAIFVIGLCAVVIVKARSITAEEPTITYIEERGRDWQWPSREWAQSRTEER